MASGSADDLGLFSTEHSSVSKMKIPARSLSLDWSPDGQILAIGLYSGSVMLKDKQGASLVNFMKHFLG